MLSRLARLFTSTKAPVARSYEGAGGGRRWRGFSGMAAPPLAAQLAARGMMQQRARALTNNNPLAASGADAWTSALVGTGIKPQSAHPDAGVRAALNSAWERWTDEADADGLGDHYAQQGIAARRMVVDGEVFAALAHDDEGALRVRLVDAEQVDPALHRDIGGGARIVAGIEMDGAGRRTAYHLFRDRPGLPLGTRLDAVRVPAADMCHVFNASVPGQVRGVSWFAPVLLKLADFDRASDAQLQRQLVAALFAGFITDVSGTAAGFTGDTDAAGNLDGGLEPGVLKVLAPGQDIRFSDPAKVGAEVIDFLKITAREIAAGLGLPYETLTGDLSGTNYSSIRAGLVAFRRRVEAVQHHVLVFQLCRPVWRRFVTTEILSGRIRAPGFERDPEPYLAARWITPRQEWVDPEKDVSAEVPAISHGLMSRRQAVASRGYDLEELDAEIAADKRRAEGQGLDLGAAASATKEAA